MDGGSARRRRPLGGLNLRRLALGRPERCKRAPRRDCNRERPQQPLHPWLALPRHGLRHVTDDAHADDEQDKPAESDHDSTKEGRTPPTCSDGGHHRGERDRPRDSRCRQTAKYCNPPSHTVLRIECGADLHHGPDRHPGDTPWVSEERPYGAGTEGPGPLHFAGYGLAGQFMATYCAHVIPLVYRTWMPEDIPFLWEMLYQSLHVREGHAPFPRSVLREPDIAHYLMDFGSRDGDDARVCVDASGERVGAAWIRRMTAADPGYGYVSDQIPEVGMAVVDSWRGQGIGRRLLEILLDAHPRMSLSVDDENVGAVGLYRSIGFVPVESVGGSTTMVVGTR